jgi:hypothetical protein
MKERIVVAAIAQRRRKKRERIMKMFVKVYVCARSAVSVSLFHPLSLSLLLSQYMMHFEIPLKTSVFDIRRMKESV